MQTHHEAILRRYVNAYQVARAIGAFGTIVKVLGIFAGMLLVALPTAAKFGLRAAGVNGPADKGIGLEVLTVTALPVAGIIITVAWIVGVLICARGELLKAALDSAVHGSPFLTDNERAEVMGVPVPRASAVSATV